MRAHEILNLLNKLRQKPKCEVLPSIASLAMEYV